MKNQNPTQAEFKEDGNLTVNVAERFDTRTEAALLGVMKSWPSRNVTEMVAMSSANWAVMNGKRQIKITPNTERARRFLARFWDGHITDEQIPASFGLFYDPENIRFAASFFFALDEMMKEASDGKTISFYSDSFTLQVSTGTTDKKDKKDTINKEE